MKVFSLKQLPIATICVYHMSAIFPSEREVRACATFKHACVFCPVCARAIAPRVSHFSANIDSHTYYASVTFKGEVSYLP